MRKALSGNWHENLDRRMTGGQRVDTFTLQWLTVLGIALAFVFAQAHVSFVATYPTDWQIPVAKTLNTGMEWFLTVFDEIFLKCFRAISWSLGFPVRGVSAFLQWLPWSVVIAVVIVIAHCASGWRLAIFTFFAMLYMVVIGYWDESMNSLALVALSVPLAVGIGFLLGVWGFYRPQAERWMNPLLDLMQTIPAFAYLIPIIILFGFGPVVGLIASVIFAIAPMVRNTIVGLRAVPAEIIDSGIMSGATPAQLFFQVRIPSALQQILLGINQTTMAALSMVIIASIIGGTNDIGWAVLSAMRKALFGESLLAGIVIALMAMLMDRITAGLAVRQTPIFDRDAAFIRRYPHMSAAAALIVVFAMLSVFVSSLAEYPDAWVVSLAQPLNDAISHIVLNWRETITSIKTAAYFYFMLPVRIGLEKTITPHSWGFALSPVHIAIYGVLAVAIAAAVWRYWSKRLAVGIAVLAMIFYFGLENLPWPAVGLMMALVAYQLGGVKLAAGVSAGLAYLLVTGIWVEAILSVYLCGLAVFVCFVVGTVIGVVMSESDRFSAFMRPINDTLQTMPLFVLLIPAVMIFKLGDFTALIAIIIYAIVPVIRYTEHGLRNLPKETLEAAGAMGTTRLQLLFQVKLPMALPNIMLGLNQTVLYAVAMLVIAALVGTSDLGQLVYIGLSDGDFGVGIVAGLGMAVLAIIADRVFQAASRRYRESAGLA